MQETVPVGEGTMGAILGLAPEEVDEICRLAQESGQVEPANYNCPGQVVIAGHTEAVLAAGNLATARGARLCPPWM